jgi:hypothetical protein
MTLRIGIVGYSTTEFDEERAKFILDAAIAYVRIERDVEQIEIVSGLTNIGIPKLAYELAEKYGYPTRGIACSKATDYACFPCDHVHIVGQEWGEESTMFLTSIDFLIRIGGGVQSHAETVEAIRLGIPILEFDLDEEDEGNTDD